MSKKYVVVIPIYNESKRATYKFFNGLLSLDIYKYVLVDDGSTDNSKEVISNLMDNSVKVEWVTNEKNCGKAESIRKGLMHALDQDHVVVTADADGAVEVGDIQKLIENFERFSIENEDKNKDAIFSGARVRLAGNQIARTPLRQWIGRLIATLINLLTKIDMYDPQSPLKIYNISNSKMKIALSEKFSTRWFYEMELFTRLSLIENNSLKTIKLVEVPIDAFHEVPGSNLKKRHIFKVAKELTRLYFSTCNNQRNLL